MKGVGVDCGGLLYNVYATQFALKPFPEDYPPDWALHRGAERYLEFVEDYISEAPRPLPADIVVFRIGRTFSHGGIVTERGWVIHAWGYSANGFVMETPMHFFAGRARKFYRVDK